MVSACSLCRKRTAHIIKTGLPAGSVVPQRVIAAVSFFALVSRAVEMVPYVPTGSCARQNCMEEDSNDPGYEASPSESAGWNL